MSDRNRSEILPLFQDAPGEDLLTTVRPWRSSLADAWPGAGPSPAALEGPYLDLVRRNLEFLEALDRTGPSGTAPDIARFRALHHEVVDNLVRWREEGSPAGAAAEMARVALETVAELAALRRRIVEGLDPRRRRDVLALEARVRVPDRALEDAVALAEFRRAEARGEVIELRVSSAEDALPIGPSGTSAFKPLLDAYMAAMKAEQERRPLPTRGRLAGLLNALPVEWLDAVWEALELGHDPPRRRKERERLLAQHLTAQGTLHRIVEDRLAAKERQLLGYLLERNGRAAAAAVTRRFGSDRRDGWFWNEAPPTSALGRVRLHGLAFVGMAASNRRRTRTVLVPKELQEPLREALAAGGVPGHDEGTAEGLPASPLWPEIQEALEAVFPDGVVEPVGDAWPLADVQDELRRELARIAGSDVLYDSTMEDVPSVRDDDEEDWAYEVSPEWERSYILFFLGARGKDFRFEIVSEILEEDGRLRPTSGFGRIGCVVAVSEVAPFALIRLSSLDTEEEIGTPIPDIGTRVFDAGGRPQDEESFFREMLEADAEKVVDALRERVAGVLEAFGITTLTQEQAARVVPGLEPGDGVFVGRGQGDALTVEDAFFFSYV